MLPDIDFTLYTEKNQSKGFKFRNEDDTYYDFTGSTVRLDYYKAGPTNPPISIEGIISLPTADVTFLIPSNELVLEGNFEYVVVETRATAEQLPLLRGNIVVTKYIPFSDSIESYLLTELPMGFTLDNNFVNQKIKYWRLFLQDGFDIKDSNLNSDSAWPTLVNVLIAKLVAYDALVLAIKGNLLTIFGSNSTATSSSTSSSSNAGGIKSITTGPSKVEFHAAGETMSQIIKSSSGTSSGTTSILSNLAEDLCGLARKLTVKLPMCKADNLVKVFQFYKNPATGESVLEGNSGEISRG